MWFDNDTSVFCKLGSMPPQGCCLLLSNLWRFVLATWGRLRLIELQVQGVWELIFVEFCVLSSGDVSVDWTCWILIKSRNESRVVIQVLSWQYSECDSDKTVFFNNLWSPTSLYSSLASSIVLSSTSFLAVLHVVAMLIVWVGDNVRCSLFLSFQSATMFTQISCSAKPVEEQIYLFSGAVIT